MKKSKCILFFLLSFQAALAQVDDTLQYISFKDKFGIEEKAPIINAHQILVVKGDSIFFIPDEAALRNFVNKNQRYDIIRNKDSVMLFLQKRIKALIVIKPKKN